MGLVSFAVSFLGLLAGQLWFAIWEMVRIGNDHFGGNRAARNLWGEHAGELFMIGIVVFWVIALLRYVARSDDLVMSGDNRGPHALLPH